MNRKQRIQYLKEEIQKLRILIQGYKKEIEEIDELVDLKMSELWNALENLDLKKGFESEDLKIVLEKNELPIADSKVVQLNCVIISNYRLQDNQHELIILHLKEKYKISNVNIECKISES